MRARSRIVVVLAAALLAAPLAAALAATSPSNPSVDITDAKRDVAGNLDIVALSFTKGADGRLRAIVTMAKEWENGALLTSHGGPPGSICLRLWTRSDPDGAPADYLACATVQADGATLRGEILKPSAGHLPQLTGKGLALSRPTGRSITMRFAKSAIGSPASVRVVAEATRPGCDRLSCTDRAPDAPQTETLGLAG